LKVTDSAIERIRAMIAEGQLGPGDRLPPEHELAERLGVSRGSLREAVRALAQINVLSVRRGDGTYVTGLEPRELLAGMAFAIDLLQGRKLDEILEVRRLLLPQAVALAAQRVTANQLERMRVVVAALEEEADPDEIARLHVEFHAIIAEATSNEALTSILDALQLRADHVRRWWLNSYAGVALAHQKLLLDAFERGDPEMAQSVVRIQVDERQRWLDKVRGDAGEPGELSPLGSG
jgi:GntR family transcriptional regulator, transcriptional repressor for pyruvate dehydrogenase complex